MTSLDERKVDFPSRRGEMNDEDPLLLLCLSGENVVLELLGFFFARATSSSSFFSRHDASVSSSFTACLSFPSSRKHLAIENVTDAAFG